MISPTYSNSGSFTTFIYTMKRHPSPIIQPEELIAASAEIILIDASAGPGAPENYTKQHLEGALYVSLNTQLANVPANAANGGRHPLPLPGQFAQVLGQLGISAQSHVVIYDDKNGSNAAARFWWMLRAAGHTNVQVLNGGFQAAVDAGFPVSSGTEQPQPTSPYPFTHWQLPTATIDEVEAAAADTNHMVIDVRDADRYNSLTEPIDLIAGHIPGAVNIPFSSNLDDNGLFLSATALKDKYITALAGTALDNAIVHCGSGVTACHTILAMDYAGLPLPKLYVGSWSEWSRSNKKLATKP